MNDEDAPWRCSRLTVPCCVDSPDRWRSGGRCGGSLCHPHCHSHHRLHQLPSRQVAQTCGRSNFLQRGTQGEARKHEILLERPHLQEQMTTNVHLRLIVGQLNDNRFMGMQSSSFHKQQRNDARQRWIFMVFVELPWLFALGWFCFQNCNSCCSSSVHVNNKNTGVIQQEDNLGCEEDKRCADGHRRIFRKSTGDMTTLHPDPGRIPGFQQPGGPRLSHPTHSRHTHTFICHAIKKTHSLEVPVPAWKWFPPECCPT